MGAKISLPGADRPVRKGFGAGPFDAGAIPCALLDGFTQGEFGPLPCCQLNPPSEALENGSAGSGNATLGYSQRRPRVDELYPTALSILRAVGRSFSRLF